eukprot:1152999-Pelagomonas_calceolata.AAC.2
MMYQQRTAELHTAGMASKITLKSPTPLLRLCRDLVPLGGQRGGFNFNLDDKRVMNMTNEVKDEDNIKQDMSIDVYGRKEADEKKAVSEEGKQQEQKKAASNKGKK